MNVKKVVLNKDDCSKFKLLSKLNDPPIALYFKGQLKCLDNKVLTVVGSRRPSPYGLRQLDNIISSFKNTQLTICSGLALGIDSAAHTAALNYGLPTIAILPSGIDNIYPACNYALAERILNNNGLIISESDGQYRPKKYDFVKRNRLIAALSDAIYIPEAALKSGSLHTADFGLDLGVDIYATPGSVESALSAGTNGLINQGANMLLEPKVLAESIGIKTNIQIDIPQSELLQALVSSPRSLDSLSIDLRLSPEDLSIQLSELEISGEAVCSNGLWRAKIT